MAELIEENVPESLLFRLTRKEVETIRNVIGKTSITAALDMTSLTREDLHETQGGRCTLDNIYVVFNEACLNTWKSKID